MRPEPPSDPALPFERLLLAATAGPAASPFSTLVASPFAGAGLKGPAAYDGWEVAAEAKIGLAFAEPGKHPVRAVFDPLAVRNPCMPSCHPLVLRPSSPRVLLFLICTIAPRLAFPHLYLECGKADTWTRRPPARAPREDESCVCEPAYLFTRYLLLLHLPPKAHLSTF